MLQASAPPVTAERVLAKDLAAALDPVIFAQRCGIEPDAWQADVLRSNAPRMLLNCSRQSGKTMTTALLGLHTAIYEPDSLVLILSPSLRQSSEFFRTLSSLYTAIGAIVPSTAETLLRLELENGSRVLSLPASERTVRGLSRVALLLVDEASQVSDSLYATVRPMLATSGGRLIALSTPFGKRGWWSDAWHSANPWKRVKITAEQCPRISPEFLAEEREELGEWWYRQEYTCEFMDAETAAFRTEDIGQKIDPTAIVATERQDRNGIPHYLTRIVSRLPLGTSYPEVADTIAAVVRRMEARSRADR